MAAKKTILTKDQIVSIYMNYVLEHSENQSLFVISQKLMILPKRNFMLFLELSKALRKKFSRCLQIKRSSCFLKIKTMRRMI